MAQQQSDNFQVNAPKNINQKNGKWNGSAWVAFASVSEAQTLWPRATRYIGLTQIILKAGVTTEYWYRDDVDTLIEKIPSVGVLNLQSVTTGIGNNATSNALQVTGSTGLNPSTSGAFVGYNPTGDVGSIGVLRTGGGTNNSFLNFNKQTSILAGITTSGRLGIYPAEQPGEAVTLQQLNDKNLQSVTGGTGNNITSNTLQVTGANNLDLTSGGLVLASIPNTLGQVAWANGGSANSLLNFQTSSTNLIWGNGTVTSYLQLGLNKSSFNTVVEILPAINDDEAINKGQLGTLLPSILPSEKITFTGSTGLQTIDFTLNNRQSKFPTFAAKSYNVAGNVETEIKGFSDVITRTSGLITSVALDGIFGDGYILLTS